MFTGHKGKSKTSEDVSPPSHTAASRFMTWTPKLLRRSFRRSSPSRTTSPAPSSSQLVFRSASSRTSLPPSGSSHNSLHSSRSRSMLPPTSSPPPRPTSPPERPAPPNILLTQSADTTPVAPRRRALYTASSPVKPGTSSCVCNIRSLLEKYPTFGLWNSQKSQGVRSLYYLSRYLNLNSHC